MLPSFMHLMPLIEIIFLMITFVVKVQFPLLAIIQILKDTF